MLRRRFLRQVSTRFWVGLMGWCEGFRGRMPRPCEAVAPGPQGLDPWILVGILTNLQSHRQPKPWATKSSTGESSQFTHQFRRGPKKPVSERGSV